MLRHAKLAAPADAVRVLIVDGEVAIEADVSIAELLLPVIQELPEAVPFRVPWGGGFRRHCIAFDWLGPGPTRSGLACDTARVDLLHNVQVPPGDGPHPTIVVIHGWGASGHDLFGLAPILHGGRALVISPQGTVPVPIGPNMPNGWGWFPLTGGGPPDPEAARSSLAQLRAFLDEALPRYGADPKHTVLVGFSQGGVMAYQLALSEPGRWAGLAALSSWLPEELTVGVQKSEALAALPILLTHGSEDPMIPIARGYESRDRLLELGASPAFREYPMGHEIRPEALRDLVAWLEDKVFQPFVLP